MGRKAVMGERKASRPSRPSATTPEDPFKWPFIGGCILVCVAVLYAGMYDITVNPPHQLKSRAPSSPLPETASENSASTGETHRYGIPLPEPVDAKQAQQVEDLQEYIRDWTLVPENAHQRYVIADALVRLDNYHVDPGAVKVLLTLQPLLVLQWHSFWLTLRLCMVAAPRAWMRSLPVARE